MSYVHECVCIDGFDISSPTVYFPICIIICRDMFRRIIYHFEND